MCFAIFLNNINYSDLVGLMVQNFIGVYLNNMENYEKENYTS